MENYEWVNPDARRTYEWANKIKYSEFIVIAENTNNEYLTRIRALANHYKKIEEHILKFPPQRFICSYFFDYLTLFTPIEFQAWQSIRYLGHMALYPQYPAGNYILDFGNPVLKIGIEVDGKDFHDPKKDYQRDLKLNADGWTIYRASGIECTRIVKSIDELTSYDYLSDIDFDTNTFRRDAEHWGLNTVDGLLWAIQKKHFKPLGYFEPNYEVEDINFYYFTYLIDRILSKHNILEN